MIKHSTAVKKKTDKDFQDALLDEKTNRKLQNNTESPLLTNRLGFKYRLGHLI